LGVGVLALHLQGYRVEARARVDRCTRLYGTTKACY
jgi:hypothetical protein